jgi:undecaprenyl-phosphate 4-deoxy-4-formamido-L-arabinose transferase
MPQSRPEISVVVPVYNEAATLRELHQRIAAAMGEMGRPFEIVMVDDGSSDGSLEILKDIRNQDNHLRIVRLARNFGQSPALYAGFSVATGDYVVMIDADLQNYPEDIPLLVEKLDEGFDMVSGWRVQRQDTAFRRTASKLLNFVVARITKVPLHDYGCALKAFRREIVEHMALFTHQCRYLPVDVAGLGGRVTEVEVRHDDRAGGESKYGIFRLIRTGFDLLTSITSAPLQFIGLLGWIFSLIGFGMAIRVLWIRLIGGNILQTETIIAIFFFLSGVQMVATGMMCEYISRIYIEVQRRPYYIIKEVIDNPTQDASDDQSDKDAPK